MLAMRFSCTICGGNGVLNTCYLGRGPLCVNCYHRVVLRIKRHMLSSDVCILHRKKLPRFCGGCRLRP
jgi:hypothetical protein